jgi:hypothetical protein
MDQTDALNDFHPLIRGWFERTYGTPTAPQTLGWPSISSGRHTLILAPTGSGKTLAAFLWAINHLVEQHLEGTLPPGVRILYVSPLKALNNDIERNLEGPLLGIRDAASEAGLTMPAIRTGVRTGDVRAPFAAEPAQECSDPLERALRCGKTDPHEVLLCRLLEPLKREGEVHPPLVPAQRVYFVNDHVLDRPEHRP